MIFPRANRTGRWRSVLNFEPHLKMGKTEEKQGTAAHLEEISDTSFELLATAVLRFEDADCRALIHTGLNAAGRPIASPVDGFVRVPGSRPPRYVLVQHTTVTDPQKLRAKWLSGLVGGKEKGDLLKAVGEAEQIQSETPDAQFRVILSTSRRVAPSLAKEVYAAADRLGLECELWEQSRFTHSLDHTPDGQWVRQVYLGRPAERLSLKLLLEIGERSLDQYAGEFRHTRPQELVDRSFDKDPGDPRTETTLRLLVGESGFGKSATAYAALAGASREGHPVLWIPAEDLIGAHSLAEAVDATLRRLHPTVEAGAGYSAIRLAPAEKRLVLAIDDLHRLDSPDTYLHRLAGWCRPDEDQAIVRPLVLCPTRSIQATALSEEWIERFRIGRMSESEAVGLLRVRNPERGSCLDEAMLRRVARALGYDPIALALFGEVTADGVGEEADVWRIVDDVLEEYVNRQALRIADIAKTVPEDVLRALDVLALAMLRQRRLVPTWDEVRHWLAADAEALRFITLLSRDETLCRIDRATGSSRFVFRHDRVRDHVLVRALSSVIVSESHDVIAEPGYTFLVSSACARSRSPAGVARLRNDAPLALVALLRETNRLPLPLVSTIREEVRKWMETIRENRDELSSAERESISGLLVDADDALAVEVVNATRGHWGVLVRLRHGDASAGAEYCGYSSFLFNPDAADLLLDDALSRALCVPGFVLAVEACLLEQGSVDRTEGALILAGRLALPELAEAVRVCWGKKDGNERLLGSALWAGLRCATPTPEGFAHLAPLLDAWEAQPEPFTDSGSPEYMSPQGDVAAAFRAGVREGVLGYLLSQALDKPALRGRFAIALERVDAPAAVEFVARTIAGRVQDAEDEDEPFWTVLVCEHLRKQSETAERISDASLRRLREIWTATDEDAEVRRQAARMWMAVMGQEAVPLLQREIQPGAVFHRDAVWHRAVHGDQASVPEVLQLFSDSHVWLRVASRVWSPEIRREVNVVLEGLAGTLPADFSGSEDVHYDLAELLIQIPRDEAEALLEAHWAHLRYGRLFIQAALRVGTPRTLALASEAIAAAPADADLFRYVTSPFLPAERGLEEFRRHMMALQPYFARIEERYLVEFAKRCISSGLREWAVEQIAPHLTERQRRLLFPSDGDLWRELEEADAGQPDRLDWLYWIHWASEQPDGLRRALDAAERFCREDPTPHRYRVLTEALQRCGTRADLARLDGIVPVYVPWMLERMAQETRFVVESRHLE